MQSTFPSVINFHHPTRPRSRHVPKKILPRNITAQTRISSSMPMSSSSHACYYPTRYPSTPQLCHRHVTRIASDQHHLNTLRLPLTPTPPRNNGSIWLDAGKQHAVPCSLCVFFSFPFQRQRRYCIPFRRIGHTALLE